MLRRGAQLCAALLTLSLVTQAHAEDLPQFKFETYPSQLFWLGISFVLLYLLVGRIAIGKIGYVQTKRSAVIETDLKEAAAAQERATALLTGAEKALTEARNKAQASQAQLVAEAQATASKRQADQQAVLNQRLAEAEQKIRTAREQAMAQAPEVAADIAQQILKQLAQLDVNAADIKSQLQGKRKAAA